MAEKTITSFEEFWPFYLSQHAHPMCRKLHFIGSTIAFGTVATALATGQWWLLPAAPVAGYGFAWIGHFLVEKNRPATFTYPLWSLQGDVIMWWKTATMQIDAELEKYGITWPPSAQEAARLHAV